MKKSILRLSLSPLIFSIAVLFNTSASSGCPTLDLQNIPSVVTDAIQTNLLKSETTNRTATAQKQKKELTGNASCGSSPNNQNTEIKTSVYDFVSKPKNLEMLTTSPYLKANKNLSDTIKNVKETFFIDESQEQDAAKRGEKEKKAILYAKEIAEEATYFHNNISKILHTDADSVKKATGKGCNQHQAHAMQNRNIKSMEELLIAQIALQIIQMETIASRNLLNEEMILVENPDRPSTTSGGKS